jgi:2-amino-4-hydroxy-6-hydroxymethyldihydropteridine diphosphokinase
MRVGVALGSNLGDRLLHMREGRKAIVNLEGVTPPVLSSGVYETDPVDCESGAPKFLNAVIEFSYNGDPSQLIGELKQLEVALGRPAAHERNVSRPIDIDLLYVGDTILNNDRLTLPHPRIDGRRFVLLPLADIQPDFVLPGRTRTVRELLASAPQSGRITRLTKDWEPE